MGALVPSILMFGYKYQSQFSDLQNLKLAQRLLLGNRNGRTSWVTAVQFLNRSQEETWKDSAHVDSKVYSPVAPKNALNANRLRCIETQNTFIFTYF